MFRYPVLVMVDYWIKRFDTSTHTPTVQLKSFSKVIVILKHFRLQQRILLQSNIECHLGWLQFPKDSLFQNLPY